MRRLQCQRAIARHKRLGRTLQAEQRMRTTGISAGMIGLAREQRLIGRQRLVEPPHLQQRAAAIVDDIAIVRREGQRVIVAGDRLVERTERVEHEPEIRHDLRRLRPRGQRAGDQLQCFGTAALLITQHAEHVLGVDVIGRDREDRLVSGGRLGDPPGLMQRPRLPKLLRIEHRRGLRPSKRLWHVAVRERMARIRDAIRDITAGRTAGPTRRRQIRVSRTSSARDIDCAQKQKAPRFPAGLFKIYHRVEAIVLGRPGSDLLFQALRLSTIGAEEFNGRVRDGIGFRLLAKTTRSAKDNRRMLLVCVSSLRTSSFRFVPSGTFRFVFPSGRRWAWK